MGIRDYTEKELQDELDRRELIKNKPIPLAESDLKTLKKMAVEHVDNILNKTVEETDYKFQFYVVSMKAIYGDNIFEWIRNNE